MSFQNKTIYQIYPRSFRDSTGSGVGDLRGIIEKVPYIASLGVDMVWFNPFFVSPQRDNGYDIADYRAVNPALGTMEDFEELVAALDAHGIGVMLDMVLNHTSTQHEWFQRALAGERDYQDFYYLRPGGPNGELPNNWISKFGGPAWASFTAASAAIGITENNARTNGFALNPAGPDAGDPELYYLHLFDITQADLNWHNPRVRQEMADIVEFWKGKGVKGFRFDVINLVSKQFNADGTGWFFNGPRIHEFVAEMHENAWGGKQLITVGECPGATVDDAVRFTDPSRGEFDMVFQFEHMGVDHGMGGRYDIRPVDWARLKSIMARWQDGLADVGWNSLYWCNHDQPRPVSRYGAGDTAYRAASAKALATVLHLHRGTPYVYQGEELGMVNYPFTSLEQLDDVESRNWSAEALGKGMDPAAVLAAVNVQSRDHARTPMQWDSSEHAGFTTGTPWLPVNPAYREINAAAQVGDPESVFAHYQRLIALRRELPVVVDGRFELLLADHPSVYAFTRVWEGDALLVVANLSGEGVEVGLPDGWDGAEVVIASGDPAASGMPPAHLGVLGPWQAWVRRRQLG